MPSAALQKLASGLSSGGTGVNDHSTPLTSRGGGGGGVIRGILQSLRAGLTTEAGSPRRSRTGFVDGQSTPRGSNIQNANSTHLDGIRVDSDVSDAEDSRSRLLSSGPNGYAGYSLMSRTPTSSDNGHIVLPLEVSMAASRSYSGRQATPARSASSARPSFEAARIEASATSYKVHSTGRSTTSGPTPLAESAKMLLGQSLQLQSSLFQASVPTSASAGSPVQPGHQEHVWTATASAKSLTPDATKGQQIPVQEITCTAKTLAQESTSRAPSLTATVTPEIQPSKPASVTEGQPSKLAAKLRAFRPSLRKRLLEASTGSGGAQGPLPSAKHAEKDSPDGNISDASGDSGDGAEAASVGGSVDGCDSCTAGVAAVAAAAAAGGPVVDGVKGRPNAADTAMGLSTSDTLVLQHHRQECQEQQQQQQQWHCRSASTNELSAMAVSQAVQRLQMRQQQEKAAARFARGSLHLPIVGAGGGGSGNSLYNQCNTTQQPYQGHGQRDVASSSSSQRVLSATSDVSGNGTFASANGAANGASAPYSESSIVGLSSTQLHSQPRMSPGGPRRLTAPQVRSCAGNYAFQHALYDAHRTAANGGMESHLSGSHASAVDTAADKGGLDEWLGGDVPDMSRGRVPRTPASDLDRKSSMSYTEGRISAAERLQAMVSTAASTGGDEAASYLQQLLLPEIPSTASVDLQYSNASTRVPSVVALAYGSSGGPAAGGGPGAPVGGLWGLVQTSCSPFTYGGYGEMHPPSSPATSTTTAAAAVAAAAGLSGGVSGYLRHSSAQGHSQYGGPASFGGSSGPGSRPGSAILNSQTAPTSLFGGTQRYSSAGGIGVGVGGSATSVSDTYSSMPDVQSTAGPHANKTAAQLVEELRELYTAPAAPATAAVADQTLLPPPLRRNVHPASSGAVPAANAAAKGGEFGSASCGGGLDDLVTVTTAVESSAPHQPQLRDELIAALWRLLRAKDSEAVSYLLAVDPASKPNGPIAPMLKEMRSWVYLNMW
ncbi:hypothetical protein Vafri_16067 [Volvox africanus]|uniref:Uncharacterized protein n=1 Tax=Volvox africanus TaxID=51714 RepID=A0A8J4BI33_9CHLO|nr:hypothetical protein Vafri_16067 [Volvox africanus]